VMRRLVCHYQQPVWPVVVSVRVRLGLVRVSGTVWNFSGVFVFFVSFLFLGGGGSVWEPFWVLVKRHLVSSGGALGVPVVPGSGGSIFPLQEAHLSVFGSS